MKKKKINFFGILGLLILAILLAAAAALFLFYSGMQKMELHFDDFDAIIASPTLTAKEHYVFTEDGDMTIRCDKSDFVYAFQKEYGETPDRYLAQKIAPYGFTLTGLGFSITDSGFTADVAADFKSFHLAGRLFADISEDDSELVLTPTKVLLGKREFLADTLAERFSLEVPELREGYECLFLKSVDSITASDGVISFTGKLNQRYFGSIFSRLGIMSLRMNAEHEPLSACLLAYLNDMETGMEPILPLLAEDSVRFPELLAELYTMQSQARIDTFRDSLQKKNYGIEARYMAFPPTSELTAAGAKIEEELNANAEALKDYAEALFEAFTERRITIANGKFRYRGALLTSETFSPHTLPKGTSFDFQNGIVCLVANGGLAEKGVELKRILDSPKSLPEGTDIEQSFLIGTLFRGKDGGTWLFYRYGVATGGFNAESAHALVPLAPEVYDEAGNSPCVTIVDLKG